MGETTMYIAQIIGPIFIAIGLGFFTARKYYIKIYREIEKETLAMLFGALGLMAVGIIWVMNHNIWDSTPAVIISFLGWATLVKGAVFAIFPEWVDGMGDMMAKSKSMLGLVGTVVLIVGIYLAWVGYF